MADVLTKEQRHRCMANIKGKNTKPEILVRRLVHRMGYRFRLHNDQLPGKPDLVLPSRGKIIFVHGCFWHKHHCRYGRVIPKTNRSFWENKRQSNVIRDHKIQKKLKKLGWTVLIVWECWIKRVDVLDLKLRHFFRQ